jgi:uncharacterized protein (TIGR01244 family)
MAPINAFFKLDESISTGAQPTHSDLEWLAQQGFKAVLNTNTNTARNYLADEGEKLAALGVKYLHQPLDCSVLTPDKYDAFRDSLKALLAEGGPVFVHCAGNVKVTGMMTPFRVLARAGVLRPREAPVARAEVAGVLGEARAAWRGDLIRPPRPQSC